MTCQSRMLKGSIDLGGQEDAVALIWRHRGRRFTRYCLTRHTPHFTANCRRGTVAQRSNPGTPPLGYALAAKPNQTSWRHGGSAMPLRSTDGQNGDRQMTFYGLEMDNKACPGTETTGSFSSAGPHGTTRRPQRHCDDQCCGEGTRDSVDTRGSRRSLHFSCPTHEVRGLFGISHH